ncbi:MAG: ArsR/SmtB family transcription factor [Candidatus Bathyarchaeia archaeon]|jgi:DNA-binding transcriptional ArsR family regulator
MKKGLTTICHHFFTNLANPTRLAAIQQLLTKPMSVTELAAALGQEQSMISHNLQPLLACNIVFVENHGKKHVYSVNRETLDPILKSIEHHAEKFCPTGGKCLQGEKTHG